MCYIHNMLNLYLSQLNSSAKTGIGLKVSLPNQRVIEQSIIQTASVRLQKLKNKGGDTRPGKRLQKTMERSTMLLMEKLTNYQWPAVQ